MGGPKEGEIKGKQSRKCKKHLQDNAVVYMAERKSYLDSKLNNHKKSNLLMNVKAP